MQDKYDKAIEDIRKKMLTIGIGALNDIEVLNIIEDKDVFKKLRSLILDRTNYQIKMMISDIEKIRRVDKSVTLIGIIKENNENRRD
jgi:hypothetical protein